MEKSLEKRKFEISRSFPISIFYTDFCFLLTNFFLQKTHHKGE